MYQPITASLLRIYNLSSTTSAKTLRELLNSALAGKSGAAALLPRDSCIMQIAITPSADIVLSDAITGDGYTVTAGTRVIFPTQRALESLKTLNTATVSLELYYDQGATNV